MTRRICVLFVLGSGLLLAADTPETTFELMNGRFWNSLSSESRQMFLVAQRDGWILRGFTEDAIKAKVVQAFAARTTVADVSDMVTSLYREAENVDLPIGWVVLGCLAVQRGETSRDAVLMALRRHLSEQLNKKDANRTELDPIDIIQNPEKKNK
jgi:hypothetical protein